MATVALVSLALLTAVAFGHIDTVFYAGAGLTLAGAVIAAFV